MVVIGLVLWLLASCSNTSGPDLNDELPDPVALAIRYAFALQFNIDVPEPAYYNGPEATSCTIGPVYLTAVAYLPDALSQGTRVHVLHRSMNGLTAVQNAANSSQSLFVVSLRPEGVFRVLTVLLTYPSTVLSADLAALATEQAAINQQHSTFAQSRGYFAPIVQFEFTNVAIDGSLVPEPTDRGAITQALSGPGISTATFDVLAVININPAKLEGGFAQTTGLPPFFVYMGNYSNWVTRPTQSAFNSIAAATYHHEIGHLWGWQHEWTPACGVANPSWKPFITSPRLFGWEDTDGDFVPEILDSTPYGRSS